MNDIDSRRKRYFALSSAIAQIDDAGLRARFEAAESNDGWGKNHALDIGGHKVFVKRIPLTDLEVENPFSTRNLYGLPTFYNYGVGSAGFGAFRELVANIKTTNWVLNGEIETFPLLYHYRVCIAHGERTPRDAERQMKYVEYWGGDENIGRYMVDRAAASHELILFLEHFPHVLNPWLTEHLECVPSVLDQLKESAEFLWGKGVVHFDAHFHNIVTDGVRPYLTDFGLVLDKSFDLSVTEIAFFEKHRDYDFAEVISCLAYFVGGAYDALPEESRNQIRARYGIEEGVSDRQRMNILLDNVEDIWESNLIPLHKNYVDSVLRYRGVIAVVRDFFWALRNNPKKDTPFPSEELGRRMAETS